MAFPSRACDDPIRRRRELPAWAECDLFCIHNYAGVSRPACGWRGKLADAVWNAVRQIRVCPHCGGATLLGIDPNEPPGSSRGAGQ